MAQGIAVSTRQDQEILKEEFDQLCFSGEIRDIDRRILRLLYDDPRVTCKEIADSLGYSVSGVSRRMNRPAFIKARMLFEGTVAETMQRAVFKLARNVDRIMDRFDEAEDPIEVFRKAKDLGMKEEAAEKLAEHAARQQDPKIMLEAGKIAVGWVAKQAELDAIAAKGAASPDELPSLEEARKILAEDPASQDVLDVEVEEL